MVFKGFCLLELQESAKTMVVHLFDGKSVGMGEHLMKMKVPEDAIDKAATKAKPDCAERIGGTTFYIWHLDGRKITGPPPPTGSPDLDPDKSVPADPEKPRPDDDEGWKSLHWVPDLGALTGAKEIIQPADATIALTHGGFRSIRADGSGPHAVWKFTGSDQKELLRRRLTNRVQYFCPSSSGLTISMDSEPIVLKPRTDVSIAVENLPACHPIPGSRPLNMDHFTKFYSVVDAQTMPVPSVHEFKPPPLLVEPDYCPPGRMKR
jgi:hypothetical protein